MPYKNIEDSKRNKKEYTAKNRDKINALNRKWKKNNPLKVQVDAKRYRAENIDKIKAKYQENKEKVTERAKRYYYANKERRLEITKQYYYDNREKIRNYQYIKKYGLTTEQVESLFEKQKGLCLICGNKDKLVVDHSHKTGKVRGLLCSPCNKGIGHLKDSIEILQKATKYLSKNN